MELIDRLSFTALAAINGVGSHTILRLFSYLKKHELDWEEFWVLSSEQLTKLGIAEKQISSIQRFKKEHTIYSYAEYLQNQNISVVITGGVQYPPLLARCAHPPVVLFVRGSPLSWQRPVIAVVGTRAITAYGRLVTQKIVSELSALGATVVSGFMYGVDVLAHQICLDAGGTTIGVLGYGFEHCYPANQERLFQEMLERGATFISPFAPHIPPKKGHFPARNRVVAGMSQAVVVTEAAEKSGSHITAGYALDEGRVVCAVPGPITNPYSEGTRLLLNQGAVLVQSGWEVLQECGVQAESQTEKALEDVREKGLGGQLVRTLQAGSFTVEELMIACKVQYTSIILELTQLELSGKVKKEGSKWYLKNDYSTHI